MSEYNRRSRKTRHARRKGIKPRPSAKGIGMKPSRSRRRAGTKAIHRKGSRTWCLGRGVPAWGEGSSKDRIKKSKSKTSKAK